MVEVELQKTVNDAPKTVSRSALQFFLGTILSRFSGFFREIALSAWFGATPMLAAFFVAYRFSQLLRRLFGESSLLSSFSPHFEHLRAQDPEKAVPFFRDLFVLMSTVLGGLILVLEIILFSWWKWGGSNSNIQEILFLMMMMLPGVLFVCLYALFSALLQSDRKYFLPSVAPIFFNIIFLFILWCVKDWDSEKATGALAGGVTLAFCIQWLCVVFSAAPFLKKIQWESAKLWTSELKKMVSTMGLTIVGIGAVQINSFIDTVVARSTDLAGPAYLYFATRLYQLPLALFGIALSSALLAPLARARQAGEHNRFLTLLQFALRRSVSLMIPLTLALLVFGDSLVNIIYGRGAFDLLATFETTRCLWGYVLGLVPAVLVLLLAPAFYAKKDFKTPLIASLISVGVNLILNLLFIYGFHLGSASVAVASSLAAFINAAYLFMALSKEEGVLIDPKTALITGKILLSSCLAGLSTMLISYFSIGSGAASFFLADTAMAFPRSFWSQIWNVIVNGSVFSLLFFFYAWALKIPEIFQLLGLKTSSE